jgi:hypothetical protein
VYAQFSCIYFLEVEKVEPLQTATIHQDGVIKRGGGDSGGHF